jgi:DNA-binding transcriptional ArsR family regulator
MPTTAHTPSPEPPPTSRVSDTAVLAAVANPARARILDILYVDGPATTTLLAERTGTAIGSVSHHLKVLAGVALVHEVPELAKDRRERWWRPVADGYSWTSSDFADDPVAASAEAAAAHLSLQRQFERARDWLATPVDDPASRAWSDAAYATQTWLTLSPEELRQVAEEVQAVFARWHERTVAEDGVQRRSVLAFSRGFPCRP